MRALLTLLITTFLCVDGGNAYGACTPMVFGYADQYVPPYYMGVGEVTPEPPGVSIELVREMVNGAGCELALKRLPYARLIPSLESGIITAAPFGNYGKDSEKFAYPLDKNGQPDKEQSLKQFTVIFVRKEVPIDSDPSAYLKGAGRIIGTFHAAQYAKALKDLGYIVDDGAMDPKSNLEKLLLHRIDGYAVSLASPGDMDEVIAVRYGGAIVRLTQPLRASNVWLAVNKAYYESNRAQVDQMWIWLGKKGNRRFAEILQKYGDQ